MAPEGVHVTEYLGDGEFRAIFGFAAARSLRLTSQRRPKGSPLCWLPSRAKRRRLCQPDGRGELGGGGGQSEATCPAPGPLRRVRDHGPTAPEAAGALAESHPSSLAGPQVAAPCAPRNMTCPKKGDCATSQPTSPGTPNGSLCCSSSLRRGGRGPLEGCWTMSDLWCFYPLNCWGRWPHG